VQKKCSNKNGRHLLTFEGRILYTSLVSLIMTLICLDPCQWSLMSLITGNKVKKTHHDLCAKKMFEQKRFAGRNLLTFESQKLNYFGKKWGRRFDITM
jgi:hypothetical protein